MKCAGCGGPHKAVDCCIECIMAAHKSASDKWAAIGAREGPSAPEAGGKE